MKVTHALLPLAAAMLMAACTGKGTAQSVIAQADGAVDEVKEGAAMYAPEELKAAQATLTHMHTSFESKDYDLVTADVPKFNEQIKALNDAVAQKTAETTTATAEWNTLNESVPKAVEEIQAKVDSLKPNALPKDVTKEELETAKTDLETAKATWAEATQLANGGKAVEATEKAKVVQAKVEELKNSLGMNEQLAQAG
ncbi:MAG TPA: hypothetical protein VMF52_02305 [Steroidobacteraceae bacterium]|nr:hypothetical protein [Steroidobacteraceae bacterium]